VDFDRNGVPLSEDGTTRIRIGGLKGIARPDAQVEIIRGADPPIERYNVVLPRRDGQGWRMGRVEAPEGRRELVAPGLCGARGIHLSVVTMPIGMKDTPHWHVSGEKVMYIVGGTGRIIAGEALDQSFDVEPGDAVYVPPFAVHAPANTGEEPFEFVMASNAPLDVTLPGGPLPGEANADGRRQKDE
jgi:uncharacterized RmlC-like cupin family protein